MKCFHLSGTSSSAKIASTGQAGTQAPQSMHSSGWMKSCVAGSKSTSSFLGGLRALAREARLDGAGGNAGAAVNAFVRMDEELCGRLEVHLILSGVDTVDRAHVD